MCGLLFGHKTHVKHLKANCLHASVCVRLSVCVRVCLYHTLYSCILRFDSSSWCCRSHTTSLYLAYRCSTTSICRCDSCSIKWWVHPIRFKKQNHHSMYPGDPPPSLWSPPSDTVSQELTPSGLRPFLCSLFKKKKNRIFIEIWFASCMF